MAATSVNGKAVFVGGSDNPYNYTGIGYNSIPSTASNQIWIFDFKNRTWQLGGSSEATMDHRGLINIDGQLITLGGMNSQRQVLNKATVHHIAKTY